MTRRLLATLCALCALTSAAPAAASAVRSTAPAAASAASATQPRPLDRATLRAKISAEMLRAGPAAGALVRNLTTGQVIYARAEDVPRIPASVNKLYTTATALRRLGPEERLRTVVLGAGEVDARGVWRGDLYLRGGGDPTLDRQDMRRLARAIARAGIIRVAGSVKGDESLFDAARGLPRTGFAYDRDIGGVLSALAVERGFAPAAPPALDGALHLVRVLRSSGIRVDGRTTTGEAPEDAVELAAVHSPAMRDLIRLVNVPSDNFAAEMLLKVLGARFADSGTTRAGTLVVRRELRALGIKAEVADGSGLSRADRTTPRQVVRLLTLMDRDELGPSFAASLPVAGVEGTLDRRMRGTPAQGRCAGKTGTLVDVSTLAGYCDSIGGHRIAFAIMMQTRNLAGARLLQDRITAAIARYSPG